MSTQKIIAGVIVVILIIIAIIALRPATTDTDININTSNNSATSTATSTNSTGTTTTSTQSSGITMATVQAHNSKESCYTVIRGNVYDLTRWIANHPGGQQAILGLCGKDGTAAFEGQHGGQAQQESQLASFKIGVLAQ
jgi:cytochrome b involved in lipid metabolism